MKKNFKKLTGILLILVLTLGLVAGCQKKETASEEKADEVAEEVKSETEVEGEGEVLLGTGAYPNPYTFQDDSGEIKGADIDLFRALFEGSGYDLQVEATEFASVLAGLDTERYQAGANSFSKTPEREEKYLYSKPIYRNPLGLIVPVDSKIEGFDDLAGLTTTSEPSVSYTVIVETFNEENPDKAITINYTEKDMVLQFDDIINGESDFKLESAIIAAKIIKDQGLEDKLKVIELGPDVVKTRSSYSYFIFPKSDKGEEIRDFVNRKLEEVRESGKAQEILTGYFGGDYLPDDEEFNTK
jgi:polar amino acid transport system substrate-binding protein